MAKAEDFKLQQNSKGDPCYWTPELGYQDYMGIEPIDDSICVTHQVDSDAYGGGMREVHAYVPTAVLVDLLEQMGYHVEKPVDTSCKHCGLPGGH